MNYTLIKDWTTSSKKLLKTTMEYDCVHEHYETFILNCYYNGKIVSAEDFAVYLTAMGYPSEVFSLESRTLDYSYIEDKLADKIQAI